MVEKSHKLFAKITKKKGTIRILKKFETLLHHMNFVSKLILFNPYNIRIKQADYYVQVRSK
jgi:hypothetical protein